MTCVEFGRFCELVLSDVLVRKIRVTCRFVPFERMFSIEMDYFFVLQILLLRAPLIIILILMPFRNRNAVDLQDRQRKFRPHFPDRKKKCEDTPSDQL